MRPKPPRPHPALHPILPLGLASLILSSCEKKAEQEPAVRPVRTSAVKEVSTTIQRSYPAVVLPARQAELAFEVSGRIIELPVRAAMPVKKGDLIAQLEKREFETTVKKLESDLEQATAQLAVMKSGAREEDIAALEAKVVAAEAALNAQRAQVERLAKVVERGAVARAELERAKAELKREKTALEVAQQELIKGKSGARPEEVEAQEAGIRRLNTQLSKARADLEDTALRAPFDGIISKRNTRNFANIQANDTVAVLQDIQTVGLGFDMPGNDVALLGSHEDVVTTARLDVLPEQEFVAELVEFGTQAETTTQTFRGEVSIPYPEDVVVLPGMTGSVISTAKLEGQASASGLTVPQSALAADPDGNSYVWLVSADQGSVTRRQVSVESISGGEASIRGELKAGDEVVTAGVSFLREGMLVKPITDNGKQ